jgi:hypothetical protein
MQNIHESKEPNMKVCERGCLYHKRGEEFDETMHTITVPRVFFDDHDDRGLLSTHSQAPAPNGALEPDGTPRLWRIVVKEAKSTYTVQLTLDDIMGLHGDAENYSDMREWCDAAKEYLGLIMSAKATVKRIDKWLAEQR